MDLGKKILVYHANQILLHVPDVKKNWIGKRRICNGIQTKRRNILQY